jgi:hypothetical protein
MSKRKGTTTVWDMLRDVLIAAMNKAQLPALSIAALVGIMLWRMPPADIAKLLLEIKMDLVHGWLLGYGLAGFFALGWFLHARAQRRAIHLEMDRIGKERTKLQEQLLGRELESSKQQPQEKENPHGPPH